MSIFHVNELEKKNMFYNFQKTMYDSTDVW